MPQMHQWPTSFQATDSVIIHRETGRILLGKKHKEPMWRFPGGFVDPADNSLEAASKREKNEECNINLECSEPQYIGSLRVPDPRYINGPDRIMTAIFMSFYLFGNAKGGDDLKAVRWFTKDYIRRNYKKFMMPVHFPIVELLISKGYL